MGPGSDSQELAPAWDVRCIMYAMHGKKAVGFAW